MLTIKSNLGFDYEYRKAYIQVSTKAVRISEQSVSKYEYKGGVILVIKVSAYR